MIGILRAMQGVSKVLGSSGWRVGGTYHTKDVRCSFDYSCPIAIRISECRRIPDSIAIRWPRVDSLAASQTSPRAGLPRVPKHLACSPPCDRFPSTVMRGALRSSVASRSARIPSLHLVRVLRVLGLLSVGSFGVSEVHRPRKVSTRNVAQRSDRIRVGS